MAALLETERPSAPSIMILSRTVLELSARTWWLADPATGMAKRVSRGYLEKLYSAHQNELFLAASRRKVTATGTVAEIVAEIKALPLAVDDRRASLRVGDETRHGRPSAGLPRRGPGRPS